MNLEAVKSAVDQLSADELYQLQQYIEQRSAMVSSVQGLSAEERIRRLDAAALAIRQSLSDAEWDELEEAMNEEFIEAEDESEWTD